jgi:hypothetical protein
MAGAFGFERDHYELSVALAERILLPAIRGDAGAVIVSDGFSCREQVRQLGGITAIHSAMLLADSRRISREQDGRIECTPSRKRFTMRGLLAPLILIIGVIALAVSQR